MSLKMLFSLGLPLVPKTLLTNAILAAGNKPYIRLRTGTFACHCVNDVTLAAKVFLITALNRESPL
jgi:hypothetical protein